MMMEVSRRSFLRSAGAAAATLTLANLEFACGPDTAPTSSAPTSSAPVAHSAPVDVPEYRGWEDIYRQKWTWDRVVKGTHIRVNCIAGCSCCLLYTSPSP